MYVMKRTTVFLDESLIRRARQMARSEGKSFAALVREAVTAYVTGGRGRAGEVVPTVAGAFSSGSEATAENAEQLLWTDPHE